MFAFSQSILGKIGSKEYDTGARVKFPSKVFLQLTKDKTDKSVYHCERIEVWMLIPGSTEWRQIGTETGFIKVENGIYLALPKKAKACKAIEFRFVKLRKETPEGEVVEVKVAPYLLDIKHK